MKGESEDASVVRRGDVIDRLTTAAGTVVLVAAPDGHRVVRLSEMGVAVLDMVSVSPRVSLDELTAGLIRRFGPPDGAPRSAAQRVVADLAGQHVVVAES